MRSSKILSDIFSAVIVGDIKTPYKIDQISFYHMGDNVEVFYGSDQIVNLMMNEGGVIGNIDDQESSSEETKVIDLFKGVFGIKSNEDVSIIPISKLRNLIKQYTTRYSYESVLASLYQYNDKNESGSVELLYDTWLNSKDNPILDVVIDSNGWEEELKKDIKKYREG